MRKNARKLSSVAQWTSHGDGTFSFTLEELGWKSLMFSIEVDGKGLRSDRDYAVEGSILVSDSTRESVETVEQTGNAAVIRRNITNRSGHPIAVRAIKDCVSPEPLMLGGPLDCSYIYHAECAFEWGRFRVPFAAMENLPPKTFLGDPVMPHFGATGWSPYTGIVFGNTGSGAALIEGVLSMNRFYRYWTPTPDGRVDSEMGMFGIETKTIEPGETLDGELVYLEIVPDFDAGEPFTGYNAALKRYLDFHAPKIPHRHDLIWGSWNDGPYNMVHDFVVTKNAEFCRKNLPAVTWAQIDSGYEVRSHEWLGGVTGDPATKGRVQMAHYHFAENGGGVDPIKFPQGLQAVADAIRDLGLRPAIWTGLNVTRHAAVVKNHPEWFQDNLCLGEASCFNPDVSIPECMDLIKQGFRKLVEEYGFEGIKLDFWTYGFIASKRPWAMPFKYSAGNRTGAEYMHDLLGYVRKLLGDGYLQTGCDISMGNPFLGIYADNFRYGEDIADGEWKHVLLGARLMAFLASATQRLGYLANSDSIGVMAGLGPTERRTWMTFCFISGTMLEIGGDFANSIPDIDREYLETGRPSLLEKQFGCPPETLRDLQRITANIQNGTRVIFPDTSFLEGEMPPTVWVKCDDANRPRYAAAFNWGDVDTTIDMALPEWANGMCLRDFWGELPTLRPGTGVDLAPHASALFVLDE